MMNNGYHPPDFPPPDEEPERFWTFRRLLYAIILILTLIAFLTYVFLSNWVETRPRAPRVTPTIIPLDQT